MHIPDGFLNGGVSAGLLGVSAAFAVSAVRKIRAAFFEKVPVLKMRLATFPASESGSMSLHSRLSKMGKEKIWRMSATGALLFSAQMVNFPIGDGTSGHLLGGVLAAILLGPWEAFLTMGALLFVQALFFGDGGILAFGANVFTMGIVGALGGYAFFQFLMKGKRSGKLFMRSVFVAAWVSVIASAVAASFEIAISGTKALLSVLPAMILPHVAIGFVEGIITVSILSILLKRNFHLAVFEAESMKEKYANE